jgi:acyl-CoA synthetase (AMP-forming)/AMP-acid ligase II
MFSPSVATVFDRMRKQGSKPALFWGGRAWSYDDLFARMQEWDRRLEQDGVAQGTVCGVHGEFSLPAAALILALIRRNAVLVPFTRAIEKEIQGLREIAGVQCMYRMGEGDSCSFEESRGVPQNELVERFRGTGQPGLIVFSSGSTGKPKGILQDIERVTRKFVAERPGWKTVLFLMMDHFGGFNTFLSTFAYGGMGVCVNDRSPESVCRAIQESGATLLPTTPTFLNLLLASGAARQFDLGSIQMITYGTEVMPPSTLEKVRKAFPNAQVKQTYGLSELGVLRSKSETDDSLFVKIGGDGFEVKVVDRILWIRSEANMVGYLNAPQPFDAEGWMCTGDEVEVRGEYMRIIGRKSEMINVGGQKVFPAEVESVLLGAGNVQEATVFGAPHPLMGQVVHARVSLAGPETPDALNARLRKHCLAHLAKYKVPTKIMVVSEEEQRSERFKKVRNIQDEQK